MCSTVDILGQGERALRGEEQWTCCNSIKKSTSKQTVIQIPGISVYLAHI